MIVEKGYAKINLGLEVLKKREDKYHDLQMIMTTIDLYDELYFEDAADGVSIIEYDKPPHQNIQKDLIYKAYTLFKNKCNINKGLSVKVVKRIPVQAGLGGGSADAAATLRALNCMWGMNFTLDELAELGFQIGSDIPFCIYNKTARVSGRGEIVEFIEECPFLHLVAVLPEKGASTTEIFKSYIVKTREPGRIDRLETAIANNEITEIAGALFNDLESASELSWIGDIKNTLLYCGALGAVMSGSGTAVYGLCYSLKHAVSVKEKYIRATGNHCFGGERKYEIFTSATRSFRKIQIARTNKETAREGEMLDSCETKAYAMLPLFYRRILDHYQIIMAPLSIYDNIVINRMRGNAAEVYIDGILDSSILSRYIKELSKYIGRGLKINIKRNVNEKYDFINAENYLAAILSALANFGEDPEILFSRFINKVGLYRDYHTVMFNSRNDEVTALNDAVFSYIVLMPLDIKGYKPPRYTNQIDENPIIIEAFLSGIREKNFYKMANSIYNGVASFDARKIDHVKGFKFYDKLEDFCIKAKAQGFMLAYGGKYAFALFRTEKGAKRLESLLKSKFRIAGLVTSLKSEVSHQPYTNDYLKTEEPVCRLDEEFDFYDESNPFEDDVTQSGFDWYERDRIRSIKNPRKKIRDFRLNRIGDYEGILYLHSGGSLFKQYDFIDIAHYFQKYFHDKYLMFIIDGKEISVKFDVAYLSHILGMHKMDSAFFGRSGFERLIKGEVSYHTLKKTNFGKMKALKEIAERAQGSVLIFNDIINNRLDNIFCFDRNIILKGGSKNAKFEYGITRMLTSTTFHRQNLLGIGKDPATKEHFFITSYLWRVPASIGKKDSLTISIIR